MFIKTRCGEEDARGVMVFCPSIRRGAEKREGRKGIEKRSKIVRKREIKKRTYRNAERLLILNTG